ncbi:hypothetical protein BH11CYA1_BH11CYA1_18590 [soil metagenome]
MQFEGEERVINLELIAKLWPIFEARIPDDESALAFLLQTLLVNSSLHCHCKIAFKNKFQKKSARTLNCKVCKKEIWITASTMFNRVKHLKAWLGAIFLIGHGAVVTSNKLAELAGTAISTALNIVRTTGLVIEGERQNEPIDSSYKVPSMDFVSIFCRRSLITLPRLHPSIEEDEQQAHEEDQEEKKHQKKSTTTASAKENRRTEQEQPPARQTSDLSPEELEVLQLVKDDPLTQDQICQQTTLAAGSVAGILVILEIDGWILSHTDGRFRKRKQKVIKAKEENQSTTNKRTKSNRREQSRMMSLTATAINLTRSIRGGISRKYVQIYLSTMWCQLDRERWNEDKLLQAFLRAPDISYQDILDYESPSVVSLLAKA